MPSHNFNTPEPPLTCTQIARRLARNPVSVFRALKRLKIEADLITDGGFKFYKPEVAEIVRAGMRRANRKKDGVS